MGEVVKRMALGARFCPPANLSKELEPAIVNHWGRASTATMEAYDHLAGEQWVADLIRDVRNGEEWKKSWLPFRCAHFYRFAFGRRNQNSLLKEAFLWQTTVDIDDCDAEKQQAALERALQLNEETGGPWYGMVLQMERSARGKVHIDIRMPVGMTIQESQLAFIEALGVNVEPDSSCFSPERIIFIPGSGEEILRSPEWYTLLPKEEVEERYAKLKERKLEPWTVDKSLGLRVKSEKKSTTDNSQSSILYANRTQSQAGLSSAEVPQRINEVNSQSLRRAFYIFDKCMEEAGLRQEHLVVEGARHNSLKSILSVGAAQLLTKEELKAVLQVRMAEHCQDANIVQLVDDFYKSYNDPSQRMTVFQRKLFADSLKMEEEDHTSQSLRDSSPILGEQLEVSQSKKGLDSLNAYLNAETPPPLPSPLPPFIEVLVSKVPEECKPSVAMSGFVAMGCHPEGLWWNYIDQRRHEPAFMHAVVATQSVGKSCVNKPLEYLMEDIRLADEVNRRLEAEWKQTRSNKGANKEKPKRPEGLRIQITEPDMTNAALVQRLDDVDGKFLFTNMDELELLNNLRSGARGNQVSQLIRLAFDQGYYGQERVGADSVTARVQVRWNWNAGCTVAKAQRFFRGSVGDGTLSRISFSTIIEDPSGRIPMYKPYDDSYAEALKPYIDRLNEATGEVHCEEADALAWRLNEENQEIVSTSCDEVFKILCKRANVIAHQRAMMLWLAHGRQWSKEIEDFVVWSEKYDLWCKMHFFGQMMEDEMKLENLAPRRGPRNFLSSLDKTTFDLKYLQQKIRERGLTSSAKQLVNQWKHRKLITFDEQTGIITRLQV